MTSPVRDQCRIFEALGADPEHDRMTAVRRKRGMGGDGRLTKLDAGLADHDLEGAVVALHSGLEHVHGRAADEAGNEHVQRSTVDLVGRSDLLKLTLAHHRNTVTHRHAAETTQAFIDADAEFHSIIVHAAGNATLAMLIQNLSSGMLRARMWRTIAEEGAVEITRQRHRDIYLALRAADAERASAADALHLAEGEDWLRRVIATGDTLALTGHATPDGGNGHGP
jgi:DNA-binding GntR family transcriptional regulator